MSSSSETPPPNSTRELAAIMFSDIAGYTLIMGRDERRALQALNEHRELLRGILPRFNGRMLGEIGDGTLTSFHSALDAVNCAREVQAKLQDDADLKLRIGIHVGDVVFANDTVLGDGVNVASRIHALAQPGGICISERVYDEIRNKPEIRVKDLGAQQLKNVERPIRAYALALPGDADAHALSAIRSEAESTTRATRLAVIAGVGVLLLAAVAYWGASGKRSVRGASSQLAAGAKIHSLAVLPLENLSGDPGQEYFADGMTEELTTQLAKINALRVISHTSVMQYKGERRKSLPDIAKALNVDAVVEGSVLRVGDKVRINAQLVDARADKHLWAQSYERDSRDVLALQDDLASAIAREIDIHVTPPERAKLGDARAVNPAAHEAYLKGIYYWHLWNEEGWKKSVDYLEQAVKADPNFAAAHAALARTYADSAETWVSAAQAMPKAKAAADRALELDSANPEARTVLGVIKYEYDYDWAGAERDFQRAIADNPGYPEAHHHYGYLLNLEGRIDESLAQYEKARELDPLSFAIAGDMSAAMAKRAGPEKVLEHMHKLVDMDPNNWEGHFWLGLAYIGNGQTPEGIAEFEKVKEELDIPYSAGWLGYWYAVTGDRVRAQKMLDELHKQSKVRFVAPWYFGEVYLGLGDKDRAIEQFVKSYEERSTRWLMTLKSPMYDPLRADPRFIALLKKIHLDT